MWKRLKDAEKEAGKSVREECGKRGEERVRGRRTGWVKEREGCVRGSKVAFGREEGWMKGNGGAGGRE